MLLSVHAHISFINPMYVFWIRPFLPKHELQTDEQFWYYYKVAWLMGDGWESTGLLLPLVHKINCTCTSETICSVGISGKQSSQKWNVKGDRYSSLTSIWDRTWCLIHGRRTEYEVFTRQSVHREEDTSGPILNRYPRNDTKFIPLVERVAAGSICWLMR